MTATIPELSSTTSATVRIVSTARYTALALDRFKGFWKD
jgi:hypothetical protein